MTPLVARTRTDLDALLKDARSGDERLVLVPTMGALHAGHAELIRTAAQPAGAVVVSIFVNPLQFGPAEDFDRYPRAFDDDLRICADSGAEVVFAPAVDEMYPAGDPQVTVDPGPLGGELEGAFRPGHFAGVLTVVAKLFGLVRPDTAVFGEKDYQQLVLIRRMAAELCMGVDVVGAPTVRAPDGLALSSRNRYLDEPGRRAAAALSAALRAARDAAVDGPAAALDAGHRVLAETEGVHPDYLEIRAPDLGPAPQAGAGRALVAARVGGTRLIDNLPVTLGRTSDRSTGQPVSAGTGADNGGRD